ncbi:hypothetical protein Tco_0386345 [Tanacetum coccineum]
MKKGAPGVQADLRIRAWVKNPELTSALNEQSSKTHGSPKAAQFRAEFTFKESSNATAHGNLVEKSVAANRYLKGVALSEQADGTEWDKAEMGLAKLWLRCRVKFTSHTNYLPARGQNGVLRLVIRSIFWQTCDQPHCAVDGGFLK